MSFSVGFICGELQMVTINNPPFWPVPSGCDPNTPQLRTGDLCPSPSLYSAMWLLQPGARSSWGTSTGLTNSWASVLCLLATLGALRPWGSRPQHTCWRDHLKEKQGVLINRLPTASREGGDGKTSRASLAFSRPRRRAEPHRLDHRTMSDWELVQASELWTLWQVATGEASWEH